MTTEPTTSETDSTQDAAAFGQLVLADPATLEIEVNTRASVELDPHFCASIRDHGVRQPVKARRRASDGVLVVREGQRRTLAAVKEGRTDIPVIVEPAPAHEAGHESDPGDQQYRSGEVERIVSQLTENQHRAAISDTDEMQAHQQLLGLHLTPAQIARATRTPAERVRRTTRVAQSPVAAAVATRHHLDLVHLGVIAEFDDDPEAVKALTVTALREPAQFAHLTQRLRDQRADREVYDATVAELRAQGSTVLDDTDPDGDDARHEAATALRRLRPSADAPAGTPLQIDDHRDCPGHAATVSVRRHYEHGRQAQVMWMCTDPAEHGHAPLYDPPTAGSGGAHTGAEQETDEQRDARRAALRRVKNNNKAWDSAVTVRRDWIAEQLRKKTAPKGAALYLAAELGHGDHHLRRAMEDGHSVACQLLGLDQPDGNGYYTGKTNPIATAAQNATPARSTILALAVVLGAYEHGTTRDSWRNPTPATRRYFAQLRDWGYALAEVEQLVLTDTTTDDPHDTGNAAEDAGDQADAGAKQGEPDGEDDSEGAALG